MIALRVENNPPFSLGERQKPEKGEICEDKKRWIAKSLKISGGCG